MADIQLKNPSGEAVALPVRYVKAKQGAKFVAATASLLSLVLNAA